MADTIFAVYSNQFLLDFEGKVVATTEAVAADDVYLSGLRFRKDGSAVRIVAEAPTAWPNGWPCDASGRLCIDSAAAPGNYINGIAYSAAGRLLVDLTASAVTGVVNGIPVIGSKMAMHDYLPIVHPFAFSNGFTNGYL